MKTKDKITHYKELESLQQIKNDYLLAIKHDLIEIEQMEDFNDELLVKENIYKDYYILLKGIHYYLRRYNGEFIYYKVHTNDSGKKVYKKLVLPSDFDEFKEELKGCGVVKTNQEYGTIVHVFLYIVGAIIIFMGFTASGNLSDTYLDSFVFPIIIFSAANGLLLIGLGKVISLLSSINKK